MRKLLIIFLLSILSLISFSQDEYYRTVDWKFYPSSVIQLTDSTYELQAIPIDYNDPGAIARTIGNYVVDFVGHRYQVIDSTLTTITVLDIYNTGQAPQSLQLARCYRSVGNGEAEFIGSIDYSPFDESSRWKLNGSDNELLWRHGIEYESPFKRVVTDTTYVPTGFEPKGTIFWDEANNTLSVSLGNGVVGQFFEEDIMDGQNNTGATILNGTPVMYEGSIGNSGNFRIKPAYASASEPAYLFVGIATEDIPDGAIGKINTRGKVRGIPTDGSNYGQVFSPSNILYVSTTPGQLTNVVPQAPIPAIPVALVISAHATNGTLEVRPTFPQKLEELSNVDGDNPDETGDLITFDTLTNTWKRNDYNINSYVPDSIWDNYNSAFRLYGGMITSNGDGTVAIAAGSGMIKSENAGPEDAPMSINDGQASSLSYIDWDAVASLALTDNAYNYIYYEGSTGTIKATTNYYAISFTRDFVIGRAYREGTMVIIRLCGTNGWNFNRRVQLFGEEVYPVKRANGLILNDVVGTRYFSVSAGIVWAELVNRFTVSGVNTQTGSTYTAYYRNGLGGWTKQLLQTKIDSTKYDDGDGTLGTVLPNQYGIHWVYMVHDGSCHVVYGQDSYSTLELTSISPPTTLPGLLSSYATLVGVIIIERDASEFYDVISAFTETFAPGSSTIGGDDWGTQAAVTDATLLGDGLIPTPLRVDTTKIATQSDLAAGLATKENILTKGNLTAGSTKVTIGGIGTNALIGTGASVDVNEANLTLSNIGGSVTDLQVPNTITLDNITQITNRSHTNLSDIGTNSHSAIDTHITNDGDMSSSNELNTSATWNNTTNIFSIVDAGGTKSDTITGFLESEVDGSITNEAQSLSVATNTATLSQANGAGGGSVTIAGGGINTVGTVGTTITVTGTEVDGSTTNELQTVDTFRIASNILELSLSSDGQPKKTVDLSVYAPASGSGNYIQNQNASAQSANMWISGEAKASTFQSTVATGTAPLTVASRTLVSNLNADLLDTYIGGLFGITDLNHTTSPREMKLWTSAFLPLNSPNYNFNAGITMSYEVTEYSTQLSGTSGDTDELFIRGKTNGTWGNWYRIYHSGNLTNPITGTGTDNYVPKWGVGGTSLTNSILLDRGIGVEANGSLYINRLKRFQFTETFNGGGRAYIGSDATNMMNFAVGGEVEAMRITAGGNVGIGTTAPTQRLDVNGNARFRSIGTGTLSSLLGVTSDGTLTTATGFTVGTGVLTSSNIHRYSTANTFSNDRDIVDKAYVDAIASGNSPKLPVDVATTTNITLSGTQTIDGYAVSAGQRVLVKDQSTTSANGVYIVAAGAWSRATDLDTWAELYKAYVAVLNGGQTGSSFVCNIASTGTLETDPITWVLYTAPTNILAGDGLTKTGNTISVNFGGTGTATTVSRTDHTQAATTISDGSIDNTEFGYLNNVSSNIQTQINSKIGLTSLSSTATGLTYTNTTGVFSLTSGYTIPTTTELSNAATAYTDRLKWDGGSTGLVAATGRTSLGGSTIGQSIFTSTNPSAITFLRANADNTATWLSAADFRTAIGAGTSSTTGTVTSVAMSVPTGFSISGTPITTNGTLGLTFTAGYSLPTDANQTNWGSAYTFTSGFGTNYPDLTAIEALADTTGLLRKTAANTWSLDNSTYLTSYTETDPVWSAAATNYYTKTNLQTSGQSLVHWDNITNEPTFQTGTESYISNLSLSGNTLTSTGVGSAFNSTVGNIANTAYANIFTDNQTIATSSPTLTIKDNLAGSGQAGLFIKNSADLSKANFNYSSTADKLFIAANTGAIGIYSNGVEALNISTAGQIKLPQYTSTTFDGTATKYLGVDIDGNVIKTTISTGTTTNALTMNNSGTGAASGTTFDGSVARTISYNTLGAAGLSASNTFTGASQTIAAVGANLKINSTSGNPILRMELNGTFVGGLYPQSDGRFDLYSGATSYVNFASPLKVYTGTSAPTAVEGGIYYNTTTDALYTSNGTTWTTSVGNVTKVGTPVNDQVGIWTGDGTIEGDNELKFNGTELLIGGGADAGTYSLQVTGQSYFSTHIISGGQGLFSGDVSTLGSFNPAEIATPAAPGAGVGKLYFKSDNLAYALNDGGVEFDLTNQNERVVSISSTGTTALAATDKVIIVSGGGATLTYPTVSEGKVYIIRNTSASIINVPSYLNTTGANSTQIAAGAAITVVKVSTSWIRIQ